MKQQNFEELVIPRALKQKATASFKKTTSSNCTLPTTREENKIVLNEFTATDGKAQSITESKAKKLKLTAYITHSSKKRLFRTSKSVKLNVIMVDSRIKENGGTGYDGMNWYAARWLNRKRHTVDFPYPEDTIIVNKQLSSYEINWVIRHEKIEVGLMRNNPKMSYLEAHARTLIAQGVTHEDDLKDEVAEVQKMVKMFVLYAKISSLMSTRPLVFA